MRRSILLVLLGLIVASPLRPAAQQAATFFPGINTPFGGLARTIAGIDIIKIQIADLRRQLSQCDGPGASRTGTCASRALLQAKLNYLLAIGLAMGDPDAAGAPPKPAPKPVDASDYEAELSFLQQQISQEPRRPYTVSENGAKYLIILHCRTLKDTSSLMALKTDEENRASLEYERTGKYRADVNACITLYDAKAIAANHQTAVVYCVQASTEKYGEHNLLNLCMHRHDMVTAMCKQDFDFMAAMQQHKHPEWQRAPQVCPTARLGILAQDMPAIMGAPPVRTMAELPPLFVAPPDVVIAPRPPLQIPAGTVIEVTIQGSWDGAAIDNVHNYGMPITAGLAQPLVVGGQKVLDAPTPVNLKGRIIGAGPRFEPVLSRPDTVQIAFTTDEVQVTPGKWADLKSNEVVFTVPYKRDANRQGLLFDTRIRFTIGVSGTVEAPSAQPPASGRRGAPAPAPRSPVPTPAAPPPQTPPVPVPSDAQKRAEEARQRSERIQACVQQAIRDNPAGGIPLSQAIAACSTAK